MVHVLEPLPYAYDALEPYIDAKTMEIHHDKHHATYVTNLNNALANNPELQGKTVKNAQEPSQYPEAIRTAVRNTAAAWSITTCIGSN